MMSGASASSFWVPSSSELDTSARSTPAFRRSATTSFGDTTLPRVVAVVEVGVDDGQIGGPADGRHGERHDKGDELEHGYITSRVDDWTGAPAPRSRISPSPALLPSAPAAPAPA